MHEVGTVTAIWRYPVKSMAGERLSIAEIGRRGLHADRTWAVRDVEAGATTGAKRLPGLLMCTARYAGEPPADAGPGNAPEVVIAVPGRGEIASSDPGVHRALSEYLDREVELRPLPPLSKRSEYRGPMATKHDVRTIFGLGPDEPLPDLSVFPVRKLAEITRYATPVGSYVDAYPFHLMTVQSLRTMADHAPDSDFDARRFRPTLLVDALSGDQLPELAWCGGVLKSPGGALNPIIPTIRCVMPSHPQPDLDRDPTITRTVAAYANRCLGVYGTVHTAGRLADGDVLQLDPPDSAPASDVVATVKRALMKAVSAALPSGRRDSGHTS